MIVSLSRTSSRDRASAYLQDVGLGVEILEGELHEEEDELQKKSSLGKAYEEKVAAVVVGLRGGQRAKRSRSKPGSRTISLSSFSFFLDFLTSSATFGIDFIVPAGAGTETDRPRRGHVVLCRCAGKIILSPPASHPSRAGEFRTPKIFPADLLRQQLHLCLFVSFLPTPTAFAFSTKSMASTAPRKPRKKNPFDVDYGSEVAGKYKWTQTENEVTVTVFLPPGTKAKEVAATIHSAKLTVGVKGQPPIVDGAFTKTCSADDSYWQLDNGNCEVTLVKAEKKVWWTRYG